MIPLRKQDHATRRARLTRGRSLVQSQYCPLAPAAPPIRESAVGEPPWVGCRQQHSVAVVAGTVFCDRGEGHIRLTYTAPQLTALSPLGHTRIIARCGAARDQPQRGSRNRRAARLNYITARFREAGFELRLYESMPGAWDAMWHPHGQGSGQVRTAEEQRGPRAGRP